jgi:hypothetical protein
MSSLIPDVAAFERRLAGLPVVKHPAREAVLSSWFKESLPTRIRPRMALFGPERPGCRCPLIR